MGQDPGHRDLVRMDLLPFIARIERREREAVAALYTEFEELKDVLGDDYDLTRHLDNHLLYGTSVDGRRTREMVEVLTAHGYEGDQLDLERLEDGSFEELPEAEPRRHRIRERKTNRRNGLAPR